MNALRINIRNRQQTINRSFELSAYGLAGRAVVGLKRCYTWGNATVSLYPNLKGRVLFHRDDHWPGKVNMAALCLAGRIAGYIARNFKIRAEKTLENVVAEYLAPADGPVRDITDFVALHDSFKSRAVRESLKILKEHWPFVDKIAQLFIENGSGKVTIPSNLLWKPDSTFDYEPFDNSLQKAA